VYLHRIYPRNLSAANRCIEAAVDFTEFKAEVDALYLILTALKAGTLQGHDR